MSEIVAKYGGTSNATFEAFAACLDQSEANGVNVVTTSAPGTLSKQEISDFPIDAGNIPEGLLGMKVTDLLIAGRLAVEEGREIPKEYLQAIQARYAAISTELGVLGSKWIDAIPTQAATAMRLGADHASMMGEILQAQIYEAIGWKMLDPATAGNSLLGSDSNDERDLWKSWLENTVKPGEKYILPGNITYDGRNLVTFSRGGSDISGALAAYGVGADIYRNMTDTSAQSIDPQLLSDAERRKHLEYLTYAEGRELGRNGVGLLHPKAIIPLMGTGIATEIRNTFDPEGKYTAMGDNLDSNRSRGSIVAISLIPGVSVIKVHEPGRSEVIGWAAQHDGAISEAGINLVDTIGDGADSHIFIVDGDDGEKAEAAIRGLNRKRAEISSEERAFATLVGHGIGDRKWDILNRLAFNTNLGRRDQDGQVIFADHSVRVTVEPSKAKEFVDMAHNFFIERGY